VIQAFDKSEDGGALEDAHQRAHRDSELTRKFSNNKKVEIDAARCYRCNCLLFPSEPVNNSRGRNHVNLLLLLLLQQRTRVREAGRGGGEEQ
jgi:uncharacterized protein with PIN domain